MATIEERLLAVEQDNKELKHGNEELKRNNEELKQKIELHTIAIGALVNKATLEQVSEQNNKIFDALIAHDQFTNVQLAELREKVEVQIEGKIVGLQTVVRQGFETINARFEAINARFEQQDGKIVGLQTEMRQKFEAVDARFEAVDSRLDAQGKQLETLGKQMEQVLLLLNTLTSKPE